MEMTLRNDAQTLVFVKLLTLMALMAFCDLRYGAAEAKLTTAAPKLGLPAELVLVGPSAL